MKYEGGGGTKAIKEGRIQVFRFVAETGPQVCTRSFWGKTGSERVNAAQAWAAANGWRLEHREGA